MSITVPTDLSDEDEAWAKARFIDLLAARELADGPQDRVQDRAPSQDRSGGAPTSLAAFRLQRYVARARAVARSPMARAAHTAGQPIQRMVGAYRVELISGEEVFLIIDLPPGAPVPQRLDVFDEETGASASLDLPEPINDAIQVVLDPSADRDTIALLSNLAAEMLLT